MLSRLVEPFADLVRWGEPWDLEDDEVLLDGSSDGEETFNLWR